MRQELRRQPDPSAVGVARIATVVLVLVFAGWLAWFGVAAPWDVSFGNVDVGEFAGRFAGILVLIGLIVAPLAIAAIADRGER
jgi:hypothetical protein